MSIVFSTYIDRLDTKKKHRSFVTNNGSVTVPTYEYQIIDGIKMLVKNGEKNIQEEIDSYAESCDINNIVNRFLNGETDLLNVKNGTYGDFTNFPSTYAEMFSRVQACENLFNELPVDLREKFDNSYMKFWDEFGTDVFEKKFADFESKNISISPTENGNSTSDSASGQKGEVTNAE